MQTQSEGNAIKESKVKESKVKEFIPPLLEEVESYFEQNGYTNQSAKKAFQYYSVAKWKDSKGNKVKNWKQKMISVWFKSENKINGTDQPVIIQTTLKADAR